MTALLGICGSLRRASINRSLLQAIGAALPAGATLAIHDSVELPLFNSDVPESASVTAMKQAIATASGVVFSVPEYNYSIPGGLKNALDWISSPPVRSPLRGKPVAIVGATSGMSGTIRAQLHMRQILLFSDSQVLAQPEILIPRAHERFDTAGVLTDEPTRALLARFGVAFVEFCGRHKNES
ncbi:MAG: NAD(P)H-dependent oxidoreductase [Deltaproteobacteria bacterium]|nr:NAD(P)H-dependent oxidoreductase [Deltaproteobacteria bacterium]